MRSPFPLFLAAALLVASAPSFSATAPVTGAKAAKPAAAAKHGARFDAADANADGKLSASELSAMNPKVDAARFAALDADKDGGISRDELRQAHGARAGDGATAMGGQGKRDAAKGLRDRFAAMDTDQDGALTRAEIGDQAPRLTERFATLDADGDGKITGAEMRAARGKNAPAAKP